ncbi:hypothetical protein BD779DRAFT_1478908 [Infundibulicybe gibba]|nr:hypothetical protein BD779DRAFT_1478908 [Infundibulicybe gibba]
MSASSFVFLVLLWTMTYAVVQFSCVCLPGLAPAADGVVVRFRGLRLKRLIAFLNVPEWGVVGESSGGGGYGRAGDIHGSEVDELRSGLAFCERVGDQGATIMAERRPRWTFALTSNIQTRPPSRTRYIPLDEGFTRRRKMQQGLELHNHPLCPPLDPGRLCCATSHLIIDALRHPYPNVTEVSYCAGHRGVPKRELRHGFDDEVGHASAVTDGRARKHGVERRAMNGGACKHCGERRTAGYASMAATAEYTGIVTTGGAWGAMGMATNSEAC